MKNPIGCLRIRFGIRVHVVLGIHLGLFSLSFARKMRKPRGKFSRSNGPALLTCPRSIPDLAGLRSMVHPFFGHHHGHIKVCDTEVEICYTPDMPRTFEFLRNNLFGFCKKYKFFPVPLKRVRGNGCASGVYD